MSLQGQLPVVKIQTDRVIVRWHLINARNASFNALIRTAQPNLCRGSQHWLSGYANWYAKRNRRTGGEAPEINARRVRRTKALSAHQIIGIVAEHYAVDARGYGEFRSPAGGHDLAAYLCRRYSGATLRELSIEFGLLHPDSSTNLVRRAKARLKDSAELRKQCEQIERKLGLKTEDQV